MGFVEAFSLHHTAVHVDVCAEDIPHFCTEEGHHACGICDFYFAESVLEARFILSAPCDKGLDLVPLWVSSPPVATESIHKGRAPPLV